MQTKTTTISFSHISLISLTVLALAGGMLSAMPLAAHAGTLDFGSECYNPNDCIAGLQCLPAYDPNYPAFRECQYPVDQGSSDPSGGNQNSNSNYQSGGNGDLYGVYGTITGIINGVLVPLLFAVAFIVFIWGIFEYFIAGGANEEKRKQGKSFILYGLIGFFVMLSLWGLVNVLVNTFHLGSGANNGAQVHPDYPSI